MTLVDTNILVDVFTADRHWLAWSLARLGEALLNGPLLINDAVYAEASARFRKIEAYDEALTVIGVKHAPMPREALFMAGKAFLHYREIGGLRTGVLPDFFIGAHAAVEGIPLLTRDTRRYRTYFPTVTLIAPDEGVR